MERGTIYSTGLYIQWLTEAISLLTAARHYIEAGRLTSMRDDLKSEGMRPVDVMPVMKDAP